MRKAERFDVRKVQSEDIRKRYNNEAKNRFQALGDRADPEEEHDRAQEVYREAAKKVLGKAKKQGKPWIGHET